MSQRIYIFEKEAGISLDEAIVFTKPLDGETNAGKAKKQTDEVIKKKTIVVANRSSGPGC